MLHFCQFVQVRVSWEPHWQCASIDNTEMVILILQVTRAGERWTCNICNEEFSGKYGLRYHKDNVHRTALFTCQICEQTFTKKYQRDYHKTKEHPKDSYDCVICEEKFTKRHLLKYHIKKAHSTTVFSCEYCNEVFDNEHKFTNHKENHHPNDSCFPISPEDVKPHMKQMDSDSLEGMDIFESDYNPDTQIKTENLDDLEHNLNLCLDVFPIDAKPKPDSLGTKSGKSYNCTICNATFDTRNKLCYHRKIKHGNQKQLECEQCHKTFPTQYRLKRHAACHSGAKSVCSDTQIKTENVGEHEDFDGNTEVKSGILTLFKCQICDQTFTKKHQRDYHKTKEHPKDSYDCTKCQETFTKRHQLKYHIERHHTKKSYNCTICSATFETRHKLCYHRKIKHTDKADNEPQLKCQQCQKTFSSQSRLERHAALHSGVKPVCCEHCGQGFYTRGKLKQHVDVVHLKLATTTCNLCQKSFCDLDGLREHKKRVHTTGMSILFKDFPGQV